MAMVVTAVDWEVVVLVAAGVILVEAASPVVAVPGATTEVVARIAAVDWKVVDWVVTNWAGAMGMAMVGSGPVGKAGTHTDSDYRPCTCRHRLHQQVSHFPCAIDESLHKSQSLCASRDMLRSS